MGNTPVTIHYILHGKLPVPEPDLMEWALWFGTADRTVACTELPEGFWVSTVFLGLDRSFTRKNPMLFETMTFSGDNGDEVSLPNVEGEQLLLNDRYSNWNDAQKGHDRIVARLRNWLGRLTVRKIHPTGTASTTTRGDTEP